MMRRLFLIVVASQFALTACTCDKKPVAPTLKALGEKCATDDSCITGLCDGVPGSQAVCVKRCADGCDTTQLCTQLTPNRFSCAADPRKLCEACQIDSDCPYPSDKCVVVNGEKVCGRDCAFDQNCPTDYSCRNALGTDGKAKLQQCTPTVASCACLSRGDLRQPCSLTNSFGTCGGIKTCDLVSNAVACSARTPAAELCNGIDDNCNGSVDEIDEMKSCGVGACMRTVNTCSAGVASTCVAGMPIDELCNGIDDDCDGKIDNGWPVDADVNNCGGCGFKCADHVLHASGLTCEGGKCGYTTCDQGWVDADGDQSNGCEFSCGGIDRPDYEPGADAGIFRDVNCDGFDGDPTRGIFVSAGADGDDAHDGTKAMPKKTIQAALQAANLGAKHDIFVSAGTYAGPLEIGGASDLIIAGGYNASANWSRDTGNLTIVTGGNPALSIGNSINVGIQLIRFTGAAATAADVDYTAYGAKLADSSNLRFTGVGITAGAGFNGPAGADGDAGSPGGKGGDGDGAKIVDDRSGTEAFFCNQVNNGNAPVIGAGGLSACSTTGGAGGQSSKQMGAYPGATPGGGVNGGYGSGGTFGGYGVNPGSAPGPLNFGVDGIDGTDGVAATTTTPAGSFTASGWTRGDGSAGQPGSSGRGGGGGGGGVGGWQIIAGTYHCQSYGSSAGGGGAGGCGGAGGSGGRGGGASVGLFVSNSTVSGFANFVTSGKGGDGGNGGAGGTFGPGGLGGTSPQPGGTFLGTSLATQGGGGGRGGKGGSGGRGSGGAGGSSIGIAKSTSSTVPPGSFSTTLGAAGAGGTGSTMGPAGLRQGELSF